MDVEFDSDDLYLFYQGEQKGKPKFQKSEIKQYIKLVNRILDNTSLLNLSNIKGCRLHKLKGKKSNLYSLSTNIQNRVEFEYNEETDTVTITKFSRHYED